MADLDNMELQGQSTVHNLWLEVENGTIKDKRQSKLPQTVMAELGNIFCSSLRWWCGLKVMSRLHAHPTLDSRGAQGNISHGGSPPQIWWGYWSHCSTTAVDRLGGHCNAWLVMLSEWSPPVRFTEAYIDHAIPPIKTARPVFSAIIWIHYRTKNSLPLIFLIPRAAIRTIKESFKNDEVVDLWNHVSKTIMFT